MMMDDQSRRTVCPVQPLQYEEDEIDLLELFNVVWRRKAIVIAFTVLAGVASVIITLRMPNIYQSEAVIVPLEKSKGVSLGGLGPLGGMVAAELGIGGGGSIEEMQSVLKSKRLIMSLIEEKKLLPRLFQEQWDSEAGRWKDPEDIPTIQDGYEAIMELLRVDHDKKLGTLKVAIQHEDRQFAKQMVEWLVQKLSDFLRQATLEDARENIRFFKSQIEKTTDPLLKEKLYASLAREVERQTFAMAQKYYGFKVLDPPIVPDEDKKVKPKRSLICMVATISAFMLAIFFVFFLEFIQNARQRSGRDAL